MGGFGAKGEKADSKANIDCRGGRDWQKRGRGLYAQPTVLYNWEKGPGWGERDGCPQGKSIRKKPIMNRSGKRKKRNRIRGGH